MFCADYVAAFVYHMIVTTGTVLYLTKDDSKDNSLSEKEQSINNKPYLKFVMASLGLVNKESDGDNEKKYSIHPFLTGSLAGLAASVTLYPFDFVRGGVVEPGFKRILSSGSTVPYAGMLFGLYFSCRDHNSTASQIKWAFAASTGAVLAEVPFDYAKRAMIGSSKVMLGVGLLYVPFAGLMLVMYDNALVKIMSPFMKKKHKISVN